MVEKRDVELLKDALKLEYSRHKLYAKDALKLYNPEAREAVLQLSKIEKEHYNLIVKEIKILEDKGILKKGLLLNKNFNIKKYKIIHFRLSDFKNLDSDMDIVNSAITFEKADSIFYLKLINKAKNREVKKLLSFLRKEELKHFHSLQLNLKHLEKLSSDVSSVSDPRLFFSRLIRGS